MSMNASRRHPVVLAAAVLAALSLASCDRRPPEQRRQRPTADALAATPNAVGIPYGRVILIRQTGRMLALRATAASRLGDRISYTWHLCERDGRLTDPDGAEHGGGEAVERPYTGRIALPERLVLEWSRGSTAFGWIYWPDPAADFAVYSRPFADLVDLADGPRGGRWLTRDMFRD